MAAVLGAILLGVPYQDLGPKPAPSQQQRLSDGERCQAGNTTPRKPASTVMLMASSFTKQVSTSTHTGKAPSMNGASPHAPPVWLLRRSAGLMVQSMVDSQATRMAQTHDGTTMGAALCDARRQRHDKTVAPSTVAAV